MEFPVNGIFGGMDVREESKFPFPTLSVLSLVLFYFKETPLRCRKSKF